MGTSRHDPYFAQLICQQYNINRGKGQRPKHPKHFLLYLGDVLEMPIAAGEFKARMLSQIRPRKSK